MKKEFGKLSFEQLKSFFAYHSTTQQEFDNEQLDIASQDREQLLKSLRTAGGWGHLYALPFTTLLAVFLEAYGLKVRVGG